MDRQTLALLIPIMALSIGLAATILRGLVRLQKARGAGGIPADEDFAARLDAVEQEVGSLRQQLAEAQERIDFAERLLARPRDERKV
ncbi:MAG TPA: hypothetical protein VN908_08370 [Gemmatimonadales bacterium]|nr:hypothetical protein [Gemmatimonadales bacterium]